MFAVVAGTLYLIGVETVAVAGVALVGLLIWVPGAAVRVHSRPTSAEPLPSVTIELAGPR